MTVKPTNYKMDRASRGPGGHGRGMADRPEAVAPISDASSHLRGAHRRRGRTRPAGGVAGLLAAARAARRPGEGDIA